MSCTGVRERKGEGEVETPALNGHKQERSNDGREWRSNDSRERKSKAERRQRTEVMSIRRR